MICLVVLAAMFNHYRRSTRCRYCGGEWGKHVVGCPYAGSGTRMSDGP